MENLARLRLPFAPSAGPALAAAESAAPNPVEVAPPAAAAEDFVPDAAALPPFPENSRKVSMGYEYESY